MSEVVAEVADPSEKAAAREDRRRRKVFNERLKLVVNFAHAVALAVLAVGVLRFVLDPGAAPLGLGRLAMTGLAALAIEALALYLLGRLKSED